MLNLNKNKLIPAIEISTSWGEIKGDISKQTDLVELTTDLDTSIKGWVNEQGYLTEHQDLSDYALKSEIPSLEGYATENWVESQGYVTAETLPEGIATESWVQSQGYLTEHQDLSSYALKSEIPSLDGYATEEWVTSQGYLTEHQDLSSYALKTEVPSLDGYATEEWVNNQLSNYTTNSDFTSLQNRVVTLETNYGDALNITNQILE